MLQMSGKDPKSFAVRLAIADQCASSGDNKSAIVEYREALAIKDDPSVKAKLNTLLQKKSTQEAPAPHPPLKRLNSDHHS
jgi:hypothetical protein